MLWTVQDAQEGKTKEGLKPRKRWQEVRGEERCGRIPNNPIVEKLKGLKSRFTEKWKKDK